MHVGNDESFQVLWTYPALTWFGVYKPYPAVFETHTFDSTLAFGTFFGRICNYSLISSSGRLQLQY